MACDDDALGRSLKLSRTSSWASAVSLTSSGYASLASEELAARLLCKFSTGFTLDEEERVLYTQTLGQREKLGCFTAFFNSMDAPQYLAARASFLATADDHLSCGLASGFVRAQAEGWLLQQHGTAPVAAREMSLCAYGLPMQLLISAAHQIVAMQRGGNAASHLDYDVPAVRLVLLHIYVEAAWRVWRSWALSVLRSLSAPPAAATPRSARGAASAAFQHPPRLPHPTRSGDEEGGGDGVEAPSADEFEEMQRRLLKWHQRHKQTIKLGGRAALRHVVEKVKFWGFANAAEFYAFCDRRARQAVSLTDLERALRDLRVEHLDARSILRLSPRARSRNGMDSEVELTDLDFVRLFSWQNGGQNFYHTDSTGVFLGELPAFAALAEARRCRSQIIKRTHARVADEEPGQSSGKGIKRGAQARRAGYLRCWTSHPLAQTSSHADPGALKGREGGVAGYASSATPWWGADGEQSTIYSTRFAPTPQSTIALSLNLSGGRGRRDPVRKPRGPQGPTVQVESESELRAKESFLRPTSPLHVASNYKYHPSATPNASVRSRDMRSRDISPTTSRKNSHSPLASPGLGAGHTGSGPAPPPSSRALQYMSPRLPSNLMSPREKSPQMGRWSSFAQSHYPGKFMASAETDEWREPEGLLRLSEQPSSPRRLAVEALEQREGPSLPGAWGTSPRSSMSGRAAEAQSPRRRNLSAGLSISPLVSPRGRWADKARGLCRFCGQVHVMVPPARLLQAAADVAAQEVSEGEDVELYVLLKSSGQQNAARQQDAEAELLQDCFVVRPPLSGAEGGRHDAREDRRHAREDRRVVMDPSAQSVTLLTDDTCYPTISIFLGEHTANESTRTGDEHGEASKYREGLEATGEGTSGTTAVIETAVVDSINCVIASIASTLDGSMRTGDGHGEASKYREGLGATGEGTSGTTAVIETAVVDSINCVIASIASTLTATAAQEQAARHQNEQEADDGASGAEGVGGAVEPVRSTACIKPRPQSAAPHRSSEGSLGVLGKADAQAHQDRSQSATTPRDSSRLDSSRKTFSEVQVPSLRVASRADDRDEAQDVSPVYPDTPRALRSPLLQAAFDPGLGHDPEVERALDTVRGLILEILRKDFGRRMLWTKGRTAVPHELLRQVRRNILSLRKKAKKAIYSPHFIPSPLPRPVSAKDAPRRPLSGHTDARQRPRSARVHSGGEAGAAPDESDWEMLERHVYEMQVFANA
jgi:hypothetical protein